MPVSLLSFILSVAKTVTEMSDRYARAGSSMASLKTQLAMSAELVTNHLNGDVINEALLLRIYGVLEEIQEELLRMSASADRRMLKCVPVGRIGFFLGDARRALSRVGDLGKDLEAAMRVLELGLIAEQSACLNMLTGSKSMQTLMTEDNRLFWYNNFLHRHSVPVDEFAGALDSALPGCDSISGSQALHVATSVAEGGIVTMKRLGGALAARNSATIAAWVNSRLDESSVTCVTASHRGAVNRVACLLGYVLTASEDRVIKAYSAGNFVLLHVFVGHEGGVSDLAVCGGDTDTLYSCSAADCTVRKWSIGNRQQTACFRMDVRPERIAVQSRRRTLCVGGESMQSISVIDADSGRTLHETSAPAGGTGALLALPDGAYIAFGQASITRHNSLDGKDANSMLCGHQSLIVRLLDETGRVAARDVPGGVVLFNSDTLETGAELRLPTSDARVRLIELLSHDGRPYVLVANVTNAAGLRADVFELKDGSGVFEHTFGAPLDTGAAAAVTGRPSAVGFSADKGRPGSGTVVVGFASGQVAWFRVSVESRTAGMVCMTGPTVRRLGGDVALAKLNGAVVAARVGHPLSGNLVVAHGDYDIDAARVAAARLGVDRLLCMADSSGGKRLLLCHGCGLVLVDERFMPIASHNALMYRCAAAFVSPEAVVVASSVDETTHGSRKSFSGRSPTYRTFGNPSQCMTFTVHHAQTLVPLHTLCRGELCGGLSLVASMTGVLTRTPDGKTRLVSLCPGEDPSTSPTAQMRHVVITPPEECPSPSLVSACFVPNGLLTLYGRGVLLLWSLPLVSKPAAGFKIDVDVHEVRFSSGVIIGMGRFGTVTVYDIRTMETLSRTVTHRSNPVSCAVVAATHGVAADGSGAICTFKTTPYKKYAPSEAAAAAAAAAAAVAVIARR